MSTVQEISQKVQEQTLDVVREAQNATVDAVTTWAETVNKFAAQLPDFAKDIEVPGLAEFTKQFPAAGEVADANFDFAQQILDSQREFAARLVAATKPAAE